ncbi:long-chain-fatty-acid--CoA ligase [Algiphilus sp. NNCM1]|uniref:long-chain-fatty-acid--CoA ligase n=1 Tax=Algiphilus sp. TaxID=1872431 RepID=UPI001CA78583|nr:long-chain-fatty-acid--CoA ligase [Algiphilus sp.]MBY8966973.1 long-chain-fatty-acid--CoA ligase [Algiphilus acroporae]MCI5103093.1 long-chain-fatty-acid--CoA ligase [Algiphilus sp.]
MRITQALRRAVQTQAHTRATLCGDREQNWETLEARVARLAAGLRALGVTEGDRVGILALNSDRYLEVIYAVAWAGAVANPVNIRLAPGEIAYTLEDSGARVLFVDATFAPMLPALRAAAPSLAHVVYTDDAGLPESCHAYEALIAEHARIADAEVGGDALAGLFYTGGTTGKPKGVMLSHDNLMFNTLNGLPALDYDASAVYLHAAPMFHLADMSNTHCVTVVGGTHAIIPRFDVEALLAMIARAGVTHTTLVPTMINLLLQSGGLALHDLSSLRRMLYGASPMPEALLLRAMEALPNTRFTQGYGQTEAAPIISFLPPEWHYAGSPKLTSAGRPAYGVEAVIKDECGAEVARGTVGEICARGNNVMQGYWKRPEQTADTLRDGWLHTGDLGFMDEDGFIFVVDRVKDMIITGGENVFSVEVEGALYQHPAVQEAAVIGVPCAQWGERVHAVVVLKSGAEASAEEIQQHCRGLIAGYKVPHSVAFRVEPLPVSGAGKVLKTELREAHQTA